MSYINLPQTSSYTLPAIILLTDIFTPRYQYFFGTYIVPVGEYRAACKKSKYTDHLVLVNEEDARRAAKEDSKYGRG